jgi:Helix-turn-helix domain
VITGMTQPKVSQMRRHKPQSISLERLMQALVSLDQRVGIAVRPARRPGTLPPGAARQARLQSRGGFS